MIRRLNTDFVLDDDWVSIGTRKGGGTHDDRCYVIRNTENTRRDDVRLSLPRNVGEHVVRMFGERVSVRLNRTDGTIAIVAGDERKVSHCSKMGGRFQLSIGTLHESIALVFGDYERIYLEPAFYANAVVLTPTDYVEAVR